MGRVAGEEWDAVEWETHRARVLVNMKEIEGLDDDRL